MTGNAHSVVIHRYPYLVFGFMCPDGNARLVVIGRQQLLLLYRIKGVVHQVQNNTPDIMGNNIYVPDRFIKLGSQAGSE